jgi:DNA (cytosine-5)-methyltransferase 1
MTADKPRVLDLFTGVGGARVGYERAGFEVIGVDINAQPDYPDPARFILANALEATRFTFQGFDLVHASPPCQAKCTLTAGTNAHLASRYADVYDETRDLLERSGVPYVIENPRSRPDMVLCGEMFGLSVIRHRKFELGGWKAEAPGHVKHRGRVSGMRHGEWFTGPYFAVYGEGGGKGTVAEWQQAMGIHWTNNRKSIAEAIPPAYTEYIGRQFLQCQTEERPWQTSPTSW